MSSAAPYLKKSAKGIWYVHWTENRVGKRISTRASGLLEAKGYLATWLTNEHKLPDDKAPAFTVDQLWSVYWKKHVLKRSGYASIEFAWKNLQPFFGSKTVSEVSQLTTDIYVHQRTTGKLGRKVKPQTCRKELAHLMACLHFCADPKHKQKLFPVALIESIELPEAGEPRDRWLRTEETQKLLNAAAELRRGEKDRLSRVERFLWLALETAARKEAILELTWDRVDFETNAIHYDVPGRRKTKKRRATVPISKALRPILDRAFKEKAGDLVLDNGGAVWAPLQYVVIKSGLAGERETPKNGAKPRSTGISPHVLRHTAATHMARRGVPLWIIAKILGNTIQMIEKVYAKHAPDDLREAVDLISGGALDPAE
jgi:integrase